MSDKSTLEIILQHPLFSKSRLPSLYSDFSRLATSNKDGYDANTRAWITGLNHAMMTKKKGAFLMTLDSTLLTSLTSAQYGVPLALPVVEYEAKQKDEWKEVGSFTAASESIFHVPGLLETLSIASITSWGVSKVWPSRIPSKLSGHQYVILQNLSTVAKDIYKHISMGLTCFSDHILTTGILKQKCSDLGYDFSDQEIAILVKHLSRDLSLLQCSNGVIKLASMDEINAIDIAVSQLKTTIANLDERLSCLTSRSESTVIAAKEAVSKGQKHKALNALRQRKTIDSQVLENSNQMDMLSTLLLNIDDAARNVGVVASLKLGSSALGSMIHEIGGIEKVDEVVDRVRDQIALGEEIQEALTMHGEDVEDEYDALLRAELPDTPRTKIDVTNSRVNNDEIHEAKEEVSTGERELVPA